MNRFVMIVTAAAVTTASGLGMAWTRYHAGQEVSLLVDLSERSVQVMEGGEVVQTYTVAVGTEDHPTPTGEFTIERLVWNPGWIPPKVAWAKNATEKKPGDPSNPMQGAKIFFSEPDYYLHGTNSPESIGKAASHGCVRMLTDDVQQLAEIVQRAGGAAQPDGWFDEVRANDTESVEVSLPEPVHITVQA